MADIEKAPRAVNVTETPINHERPDSGVETSHNDEPPKRSKLDDWYLWEVGGVLLSAACICTIIGLLIWLDGKKLPNWGITTPEKTVKGKTIPSKTISLSLNSVISWVSTVGKIAILIPVTKGLGQLKWVWFAEQERRLDDLEKFDNATRGLTGSAKLLWRLRGQHFATVGAIAVILALGFDPFIQALIHYDTVYDNNPKDTSAYIMSTAVFDWSGEFGMLDPVSIGAVSQALYAGKDSFRVPYYSCSSGNCTWANYETLAVGVHCTDLTSKLTQTCSNTTNTNSTDGAPCDWSLPNGMHLGSDGLTVFAMNLSNPTIAYTNYSEPLAVIQTISNYQNEYINVSTIVTASECVLFPAVKTLSSSVGHYYINEVLGYNDETSSPEAYQDVASALSTSDTYYERVLKLYEEYTYVSGTNDSSSTGYFLDPPKTPGRALSAYETSGKYHMSNQAVVSIRTYLKELLQGSIRGNGPGKYTYISELNGNGRSPALQAIHDPLSSLCNNGINFYGVAQDQFPNVQCAMERISAALSVTMRNTQDFTAIPGELAASLSSFFGNTIIPFPRINITWWWIILPLIVWLCSVTMLIGTIVKTNKAKVYLWRTNPLAMVFLQLGREERLDESQHGLTEGALIKRAENLKVKLVVDRGEGIVLKQQSACG